jgi:allantoate deiminase
VLEEQSRPLGVVSSIAGARRFVITLTGEAAHSGTPWPRRRDALAGAAEGIVFIEETARAADLIATTGHLAVFPDAVNIIAGRVQFSLDLRARHDEDRDAAWARIDTHIKAICSRRGLGYECVQTHEAPAVHAGDALRAAVAAGIRSAVENATDQPGELLSMAGHDAMAVAEITEIAMLFIRCKGGVSHHPDEFVTEEDVSVAIDAFEGAVLACAEQYVPHSAR